MKDTATVLIRTGMGMEAPATLTTTTPATMGAVVANFLASQDVRDSSRTVYGRTLHLFFDWVNRTGRGAQPLTRADILQYKDDLLADGLAPLTVGSYLTTVRKFFEWTSNEYPDRFNNIAKGVKTPKRKQQFLKQHLSDDSASKLLHHFEGEKLRNYAIVNLMLRTGLRTIEVVRANVGDVTYKGDTRILKVWGKGRDTADEFVVLSGKVWEPIHDYLATRKGAKQNEPLFVSTSNRNEGKRLTTRTIRGLCKEGLRAIGLDGKEYTAHSLRHTTAVAILKRTDNLQKVQAVLRHASPTTTQIYTASVREELRLADAPELVLDGAF